MFVLETTLKQNRIQQPKRHQLPSFRKASPQQHSSKYRANYKDSSDDKGAQMNEQRRAFFTHLPNFSFICNNNYPAEGNIPFQPLSTISSLTH